MNTKDKDAVDKKQPSQRAKLPVSVSQFSMFPGPSGPGSGCSGCPHLAALKFPGASGDTIAGSLSRPATQLLDKYREHVRCILGNNARENPTQLDLDIEWVQSIPFPACKICGDSGFGRLHACLNCSFIGCFKHKHINAHLMDQNNTHCFAVDYHHASALFCIKCNDYVWDLDFERVAAGEKFRMDALVSKLKDVSIKRTKKEEWTPSIEDAFRIQKFAIPLRKCSGLRGLTNMGSTCFMNVVLQAFVHNPLLRAHFLSDKHNPLLCRVKKSGQVCMACEMDSLFSNFYNGETSPYSPSTFLYATWMTQAHLARYAQQDAHEFFIAILNELHSNCTDGVVVKDGASAAACKCIIHSTFQGYLQSDVTCSQCRNVTTARDPILDLSLNIKSGTGAGGGKKKKGGGSTPNLSAASLAGVAPQDSSSCTLVECLERNFAAETLTHYQCGKEGCARSSESVKHVTIQSLPPVLAVQLKRFEHSGQGSKVDTHVAVPAELDMTRFTTRSVMARKAAAAAAVGRGAAGGGVAGNISPFDPLNDSVPEFRYSLFGVVNHQGSLETGHYTAFVKSRGEWFYFDDHNVILSSQKVVLSSKVYMCFYVRENFCFAPSNDPATELPSVGVKT